MSKRIPKVYRRKADRGKPRPCPKLPPRIVILRMTDGRMIAVYRAFREVKKAKPFGARCLELAIAVTDSHHAPLSEATRREEFTRNPMRISFEPHEDGKVATLYARWLGARGETSEWSTPDSMRIAMPRVINTQDRTLIQENCHG